jgi:hypothetical protein
MMFYPRATHQDRAPAVPKKSSLRLKTILRSIRHEGGVLTPPRSGFIYLFECDDLWRIWSAGWRVTRSYFALISDIFAVADGNLAHWARQTPVTKFVAATRKLDAVTTWSRKRRSIDQGSSTGSRLTTTRINNNNNWARARVIARGQKTGESQLRNGLTAHDALLMNQSKDCRFELSTDYQITAPLS